MNLDLRLKVINVTCYSGYRSNERPMHFTVRGRKVLVEEIVDRWYGENNDYFKIRANDHRMYLIKYNRDEDFWTLEKIGG